MPAVPNVVRLVPVVKVEHKRRTLGLGLEADELRRECDCLEPDRKWLSGKFFHRNRRICGANDGLAVWICGITARIGDRVFESLSEGNIRQSVRIACASSGAPLHVLCQNDPNVRYKH
jgi:hypothetical protein